jgi:flagellar biosynthesis/type III secretory pathway M-ring protein FliF/YscJ
MSLDNSSSKGPHEEEEESQRQEMNMVSTSRTEVERVPMAVKRVTASVVVPVSYFGKIWSEQNPVEPGNQPKTPAPAELDQIRVRETANIQKCVAALLPQAESVADPTQLVNVTVFQDIKPQDQPAPGWHENAISWLAQSWSMLGMIALAFFSLLMLRSMIRMPAVETAAPLAAVPAAPSSKAGEAPGEPADAPQGKRFQGGGSLLEDLSELVSNDPDTAASILRNWIGNVG